MAAIRSAFVCLLLGASPAIWAHAAGASARLSGAPGDGDCTACHSGTKLNSGSGGVAINLPGDATYTPGVKQHIVVQITDAAQMRWGFEFTARLNSAPSSGQAGTLAKTDGNTQVICDSGRAAPCASGVVQFVTHTSAGTRFGTKGGITFEFDWTPPATDVGGVTLYVAGNAANGNGSESGDHIYTAHVPLTVAAAPPPPPTPAITSVISEASLMAGTAPQSWIQINGTNLANTTDSWTAAIASAGLPTSLDQVSVQVNGNPAFVQSIGPTQVVVLTPADTSTGPVNVVVQNNGATSAAASVTMAALAPALFTADGKYLATTHGTNQLAGRLDNFPSVGFPTPTVANAGETISFYGTGFGAVTPAMVDGTLQAAQAVLANPYTVTIGGETAQVAFAGLAPGFAGVYQFTTTIPADLPTGDQPVVIQINGLATPQSAACCFVQVVAAPVVAPAPAISSTNSVVSAAALPGLVPAVTLSAGTAPASWIAINGTNLAVTTRTWTPVEATATTGLPTTLDGVSVQVNNIAAFVQAVSPTQVIVLTPSDPTVGPVNVQVSYNGSVSNVASVAMDNIAPALFTADGMYLVTTHGTNSLDTRLDYYPSTAAWPTLTWPTPTPAQPGETISFYGTGFGATDVPIVDGQLQANIANITTPYTLTVGGEPAVVAYAGLAPGFAGMFEFTVTIPSDLPDGDQPVVITMADASGQALTTQQTAPCCFVTVQASATTPAAGSSQAQNKKH